MAASFLFSLKLLNPSFLFNILLFIQLHGITIFLFFSSLRPLID